MVIALRLSNKGLSKVIGVLVFLLLIRSIKHGAEEPTIDCILIDHDRVFLIVACEARNRSDTVDSNWHIVHCYKINCSRRSQRLLRVVENVN